MSEIDKHQQIEENRKKMERNLGRVGISVITIITLIIIFKMSGLV